MRPAASATSSLASPPPASARWASWAAVRRPSACSSRCASSRSSVVLARLRVDAGDLVEAEPQQVGLLAALAARCARRSARSSSTARQRVNSSRKVGQQLLVLGSGEPVERAALLGRAQQAQLVGLAVHGEHLLADLGQHRHRHRPPADVRPRPALDGHRAAQQQRAVVVDLGAGVDDPVLHRGAGRARAGAAGPRRSRGPARRAPGRRRRGRRRAGRGRSRPSSCPRRSRR